jgi:hypothetical protein
MSNEGAAAAAAQAAAAGGSAPPSMQRNSETPPWTRYQSRGRSRSRRNSGKDIVVRETLIQERLAVQADVLVWPMLTTTNYIEWALLMQINLEACVLGDAVEGKCPLTRLLLRRSRELCRRTCRPRSWSSAC